MMSIGKYSISFIVIGLLLVLVTSCDTRGDGGEGKASPERGQNASEVQESNPEGKSLDELTEAIKQNPDNPDAYYARGDAYLDKEEFSKAMEDLERTLALDPNHVDAHILRGIVYGKMGQLEEAIVSFDKAIELSPENPTAYSNRGFAYSLIDNLDRACEDWKTACTFGECKWYDMAGFRGDCDE